MRHPPVRRFEEGLLEFMDPETARRLPRRIVLDSTESTNAALRRLADAGAPDGSVLIADRQTSGRGSRGRTWHSPPGLGLYASVLVRTGPDDDPVLLPRWTLVASLAACEACRQVSGVDVILEWPNDLLAGGRKVGGVLAEGRCLAGAGGDLVVGVGINVGHASEDFPPELRDRATSLRLASRGGDPSRERLAARLLERFLEERDRLREGGWDAIARRWLARAPGAEGRRVRVRRAGAGAVVRGRTRGIDRAGALRVEADDGTMLVVRSGDAILEEA